MARPQKPERLEGIYRKIEAHPGNAFVGTESLEENPADQSRNLE